MPSVTPNAKRPKTKANFKFLIHTSCFIILALLLSACSAIGTNKPAALQITSSPESSVFLDGKHLGKTPFSSDQLKEGEYTVKLAAGEATYINKIKLISGTLTVINRQLDSNFLASSGEVLWLEKGKEGVLISSMPGEADIILDGSQVGRTPKLVEKIEPGDHKVILSKSGYESREFVIKASDGWRLLADVTLAAEIAKNEEQLKQIQIPTPIKVQVINTPQGFLRVRMEPSTTSAEVGRVKTGDQLEIVQETKDWVEIKFDGKQGWISTQYTKKLP